MLHIMERILGLLMGRGEAKAAGSANLQTALPPVLGAVHKHPGTGIAIGDAKTEAGEPLVPIVDPPRFRGLQAFKFADSERDGRHSGRSPVQACSWVTHG